MIVLAAGLTLLIGAALPMPAPDPQAAVLGSDLMDAALDPDIPIAEILDRIDRPEELAQIKRRALRFADLQLRGLKRFCIVQGGKSERPSARKFAHLPGDAFTPAEHRATSWLLTASEQQILALWDDHAEDYHRRIRALKQTCPDVPERVQRVKLGLVWFLDRIAPGRLSSRRQLMRLAEDTVASLDIEAAFPRVQFAANGLSYNLGRKGVEHPLALPAALAFLESYRRFALEPGGSQDTVWSRALVAANSDAEVAVWLLAFLFRNYPHIYDVYLLNPELAAKLEVVFLRVKHFHSMLRSDESKMLLHYPVGVYHLGDRRSSPYHFWSGGYVAYELFRRGHSPAISAIIGGGAQIAYEFLATARYTVTHRELGSSWIERMLYFFDRSSTWEDAAGGLVGAFETLEGVARIQAIARNADYKLLRLEAWRFMRSVKAMRYAYSR